MLPVKLQLNCNAFKSLKSAISGISCAFVIVWSSIKIPSTQPSPFKETPSHLFIDKLVFQFKPSN